jgi:protocatechuate 3,4-dioxygenase beta subunit
VTRNRWILVVLAAGVCLALYLVLRARRPDGAGFPESPWRLPREFRGVVYGDGEPMAEESVELFEDAEGGYRALGVTAADGTFVLRWTPTATTALDRLFVVIPRVDRFARTVQPANPAGTTVHLARSVDVRGRVVDYEGRPVPAIAVALCVRHEQPSESQVEDTDAQGRFLFRHLPFGAALDLLVGGHVDRRFRAGDFITLHWRSVKKTASVTLRDPVGKPVAGARHRLAVPRGLRGLVPWETSGTWKVPSVDEMHWVEMAADGFLPVELAVWPSERADVILWPEREVELLAWDGWNSRGVEGVTFDEVDLQPPAGEDWWGKRAGRVQRAFPFRLGKGAGIYHVRLPTCALDLHLVAPGYGDAKAKVAAGAGRASARLQPPRLRERPGLLVLRPREGTPDLRLIVADEQGGWLRRVTLRDGRARLRVIPGRRLQIASAHAADGVWIPKHKVDAFQPGQKRAVRIGTRPALRLTVKTEPVVEGEVTLVPAAHEKLATPQRVRLRDGAARFWVRPLHKLHVTCTPPGAYFTHEGELETEQEDLTWTAHLRPAAQLRYRIHDRGQNAVPFARVRLWEPDAAGRLLLRGEPKVALAGADGEVLFPGLRDGAAAVEIAAFGFRTRRFAQVRLETGKVHDKGTMVLAPAGRLRGRVVDPRGEPVRGAAVRVLSPRVARLAMPGGGERDLYDLTESSLGDALTGADGAFDVRDPSPRAPLIAVYPKGNLAAAAFPPAPVHGLTGEAYVELEVPGSVRGVYLLLRAAAVLIKTDPPMSLRPLPVVLPAGRSSLYVRLRDGRWAAPILDLKPGQTIRWRPEFQR